MCLTLPCLFCREVFFVVADFELVALIFVVVA